MSDLSEGQVAFMQHIATDPKSTANLKLKFDFETEVAVIGAGPAGLAAALACAKAGRHVIVFDENPIHPHTMAQDIPLHYGGMQNGGERNRNAMLDAFVHASPSLSAVLEAEIDVRLGAAVWTLCAPSSEVRWLGDKGLVLGVLEEGRVRFVRARHVIAALGRRDVSLALPGWTKLGVGGMTAALQLSERYKILRGAPAVILGGADHALHGALRLIAAGTKINAIIDVHPRSIADPTLIARLEARGVELLYEHRVVEIQGADDVDAIIVEKLDKGGQWPITCGLVIEAIGATPVVDLLAACGCRLTFDAAKGGYAPIQDPHGRTNVPGVSVIGDGAGIAERTEHQLNADADRVAAGLDAPAMPFASAPAQTRAATALARYRERWIEHHVANRPDVMICQCENVSVKAMTDLAPHASALEPRLRPSPPLTSEAAPFPDFVKRITRAGMGYCQGRRCREQVAALIAHLTDLDPSQLPYASYRAPVRHLPLSATAELAAMIVDPEKWESWFGIDSQWTPYWDISTEDAIR